MAVVTDPSIAEGVRAAIAAYTQALDDGRTDDVVSTFCADGVCDIAGMGTFEGIETIRTAFAGWTPRTPQRHLVFNTLVTADGDTAANATSDVVFLLLKDQGWSIQLVGRYNDTLRLEDGAWRFVRREASFVNG